MTTEDRFQAGQFVIRRTNRFCRLQRVAYAFIFAAFALPACAAELEASLPAARGQSPDSIRPDEKATRALVNESYGKLPLSFEANEGQQDRQVKFLSRGSGYDLFLTNREAVLVLSKPQKLAPPSADKATRSEKTANGKWTVLRTQLIGANPEAKITGEEELAGKVNYLTGDDPSKWRTDVATYAKIRYQQLYPGIDLVYYGNQGQLEYDFVVRPGADPAHIRLRLAGARKMYINRQGQLVVKTPGGSVRWNKPEIYQEVDGQRRFVKGQYALRRGHELGFEVAAYDMDNPLIIDPTLVYSTYLGGGLDDYAVGVAVDTSGNAYVTGSTNSSGFPATGGTVQTTFNGGSYDVFVTKLNPTGTELLYSTYLGGSGDDRGHGIALDATGNAYVSGETNSSDFPTTAGAFQTTFKGGKYDFFATKLNPTGTSLLYSTYLGGSSDDYGHGITLDASGNAYVAGYTSSSNFPTTAGAYQTTFNGGTDIVVTRLNSTGTGLLYSTYLGGSSSDIGGAGIALDTSGNANVVGYTFSSDFPTTAGAYQTTFNGGTDVVVTQLNSTGTGLLSSTYLGGSSFDYGFGIAVDTSGNAYLTGETSSSNFPTTAGAFQTTYDGSPDVFVTKLNSAGTGLLYSTYLGGSSDDRGWGIAVDMSGNACVRGETSSSDLPTTAEGFQTTLAGGKDNFVAKLNSAGTDLLYSTYIGGSSNEGSNHGGIALDASGNAYIVGQTFSSDFPTTAGAFQTSFNGGTRHAFVAKIDTIVSTSPTVDSKVVDSDGAEADSVTVNEGTTVQLKGCAPDYSHDDQTGDENLTYSWSQIAGPNGGSFSDQNACNPTFTTPLLPGGAAGCQTITVKLEVTDEAGNVGFDTVDITYCNVNHPAVAQCAETQMTQELSTVILDGLASFDCDGDSIAAYQWVQTSGPAVTLTGADTATPSFQAPEIAGGDPAATATLVFQLTVDDGIDPDIGPCDGFSSADSSCSTTVTVTNINNPPAADAGLAQTANEGESVVLHGEGSSDPDGDSLSLSWTQTSGPAAAVTNAETANPTVTVPFVDAGGATLEFQLCVTDGYADPVCNIVNVYVTNTGDAPSCSNALANPAQLWPPDHKLVPVTISNVGTGGRPTIITVTAITQDEPVNGDGDGDTSPDAIIQGPDEPALLRAERSGDGNGRTYRIQFAAANEEGSCTGSVSVCVPKSKGHGADNCVEDPDTFDSTQF